MRWHAASQITHLIKHPVSEAQQLGEEVEPAMQEGKETQQEKHDSCNRRMERADEGAPWLRNKRVDLITRLKTPFSIRHADKTDMQKRIQGRERSAW